jgi:tetratricopeptide (TPR) repeat protein
VGRRAEPAKPVRYALGFAATAITLVGLTLVLVLVVFPRRFVLDSGLRESGLSFPSTAAPFAPPPEVPRPAVAKAVIAPPPRPGPAERLWNEVLPLLRAGRYGQALPLFASYLHDHPGDRDVRRQRAITLDRAGRWSMAEAAYAGLLKERDDPDVRLLYARALRDHGRLDEAEEQYRILRGRRPDDVGLALESAQSLAWGRRYAAAAGILSATLSAHPDDTRVRVELARIYYWAGRLHEADGLLSTLPPDSLAAAGAQQLHSDVVAALTPPNHPKPAPSLAELADQALVRGEYRTAADLYRRALEATPADTVIQRRYADVLQYRLDDLAGAREVLRRLQPACADDPILDLRIAQLEAWTGQSQEATRRLEGLLLAQARPDTAGPRLDTHRRAQARALLGDLYRWNGLRRLSATTYEEALADDPSNEDARQGLETLHADVRRQVENAERPRLGTDVYSYNDSDDFTRLDLGLEGVVLDGTWVMGARAGSRLLRGSGLDGLAATERGLFADIELGRWWRMATLRTAIRMGMERVDPRGTDATLDVSLRFANPRSSQTNILFHHGPAYPLTVTRSSLLAGVDLNRLTLSATRRLSGPWSLTLRGDAARLGAPDAAAWPSGHASLRLEGDVSLGRALSDAITVGGTGSALTYTDSASVSNGRRLFWDPKAVLALGLYAQWAQPFGEGWGLNGRFAPGLAFIDERTRAAFDRVFHVSAEGGVTYRAQGVSTKLDVFYDQGRFNGYRDYGARVAVSATGLLGGGGQ